LGFDLCKPIQVFSEVIRIFRRGFLLLINILKPLARSGMVAVWNLYRFRRCIKKSFVMVDFLGGRSHHDGNFNKMGA
jgi:hypothetical protein